MPCQGVHSSHLPMSCPKGFNFSFLINFQRKVCVCELSIHNSCFKVKQAENWLTSPLRSACIDWCVIYTEIANKVPRPKEGMGRWKRTLKPDWGLRRCFGASLCKTHWLHYRTAKHVFCFFRDYTSGSLVRPYYYDLTTLLLKFVCRNL